MNGFGENAYQEIKEDQKQEFAPLEIQKFLGEKHQLSTD
jgi:hypothetical protein